MLQEQAPPDPPQVETILGTFSGKVAFDIGANVGRTTRILARRFERVAAVEPCMESWHELCHVAADLDGESYVVPLNLALSDHAGWVELLETENPIRSGQLTSSADSLAWGPEVGRRKILCTTVDQLARMIGPPQFLKIDVEGHEVRVLRGATEVLRHWAPDLYVEVHNHDLGVEIVEMLTPWYPRLKRIQHPFYRPDEWGAKNHYWLTTAGLE